tara:strand:- start:4873 stop:6135 length:1263 start_codon:yes stop_codon:yes gene_type:complete
LHITVVSFSFSRGGAGMAANNFKKLLCDDALNYEVSAISQGNASKFHFIKRLISHLLVKLQFDSNPIKHSLNLFSYVPLVRAFKAFPETVYHLHWVNNDTLSIFDFHRIPSGSIITLHDEWLYCGSEHCYKVMDDTDDFARGYNFLKSDVYGLHWNYLIWIIKKSKLSHRSDLIYTVPSKWMLQRARSSQILQYSDVRYLPNPIDTKVFRPMPVTDIDVLRSRNSIRSSDFMICFGAIGGKKNCLKGASLLAESLRILRKRLNKELCDNVKLVDFGGSVSVGFLHGFRNISLGHIHDPRQLGLLYSAADCVVVPSMVESFGQVAAEALSCGTPVVCFNTSGLKDMVHHKRTGLVADAFDPESLADRLLEVIEMSEEERKAMGKAGRDHVIAEFSPQVVAKEYFKILGDAAVIKYSTDTKK